MSLTDWTLLLMSLSLFTALQMLLLLLLLLRCCAIIVNLHMVALAWLTSTFWDATERRLGHITVTGRVRAWLCKVL